MGAESVTLTELLSLLRNAILNDRSARTGGASDYLWTDETLITYINEAQRRFAVQGLVLRDGSTKEVTQVTLKTGVDTYALHPAVIAVMSAKLTDQNADLTRVGHSTLAAYRAPTDSWTDAQGYLTLPPGLPLSYTTDEQLSDIESGTVSQVTLRVYPKPSAAEDGKVLQLRVVRKPLVAFSSSTMSASPEIPEDHHIEMLDYAAYLALRIVDDDAGAPRRAAEFKATFEENVREARRLALRKMFAPMEWGFGRGGWNWSR